MPIPRCPFPFPLSRFPFPFPRFPVPRLPLPRFPVPRFPVLRFPNSPFLVLKIAMSVSATLRFCLKVFLSGCGFKFLWFFSRQRWKLFPSATHAKATKRYQLTDISHLNLHHLAFWLRSLPLSPGWFGFCIIFLVKICYLEQSTGFTIRVCWRRIYVCYCFPICFSIESGRGGSVVEKSFNFWLPNLLMLCLSKVSGEWSRLQDFIDWHCVQLAKLKCSETIGSQSVFCTFFFLYIGFRANSKSPKLMVALNSMYRFF